MHVLPLASKEPFRRNLFTDILTISHGGKYDTKEVKVIQTSFNHPHQQTSHDLFHQIISQEPTSLEVFDALFHWLPK